MNDRKGLVEVWLTRAEMGDPATQNKLRQLYVQYRKPKYHVVVYQSGNQDLYRSTLDLLAYNRTRAKEHAMTQKKPPRLDTSL